MSKQLEKIKQLIEKQSVPVRKPNWLMSIRWRQP